MPCVYRNDNQRIGYMNVSQNKVGCSKGTRPFHVICPDAKTAEGRPAVRAPTTEASEMLDPSSRFSPAPLSSPLWSSSTQAFRHNISYVFSPCSLCIDCCAFCLAPFAGRLIKREGDGGCRREMIPTAVPTRDEFARKSYHA